MNELAKDMINAERINGVINREIKSGKQSGRINDMLTAASESLEILISHAYTYGAEQEQKEKDTALKSMQEYKKEPKRDDSVMSYCYLDMYYTFNAKKLNDEIKEHKEFLIRCKEEKEKLNAQYGAQAFSKDNSISWQEAIKQMTDGKIVKLVHRNSMYHMKKDSGDQFRIFNVDTWTFTEGYLNSDDITEGKWYPYKEEAKHGK